MHNLKRISPEVAISLLNFLVPLKLYLLEIHRKGAEMATSLLQMLQFSYQRSWSIRSGTESCYGHKGNDFISL